MTMTRNIITEMKLATEKVKERIDSRHVKMATSRTKYQCLPNEVSQTRTEPFHREDLNYKSYNILNRLRSERDWQKTKVSPAKKMF